VFSLGFSTIAGFLRAENIFMAISIQIFLLVPLYAFGQPNPVALKRNADILQEAAFQQEADVVSQKTDEQAVKNPATKLRAISFHNNKLIVLGDGEFKKFDVYELANPPRIAIDVFDVRSNLRMPSQHPNVKSIRQGKHEDKIRIVLDFKEPPLVWKAERLKSGLSLTLKTNDNSSSEHIKPNTNPSLSPEAGAPPQRLSVQERAAQEAAAQEPPREPTPQRAVVLNKAEASPALTGKRVSFEFKDVDIHNLLRMIAEIAQKNIVVADDVQGKVTIRLKNVPWEQALELVLRSKSLGKETLGNNIIRVAPLKVLEEEARMREERARTMVRQEPLIIQLIPVSYANAEQLRDRVKEMLTERGSVSVDVRTNTLIVREVASNIERTRSLVSNLDTQTPQVLIESRIVEANTNYTKEFGIQWGGHASLSPATGNATGIAFPNTISMGGAAGDTPNAGTSPSPQYAVNLPVAVGAGSGGGLGFVFGSAGGAFQLNLRLSALETQGHVKTISAPKVTTMDNTTARISQGISLPFSQVSAAGVNTSFIEARLSLEVTPHITADGSVLMNIRAENNQPDPSNTGANGQPAIQRKEATTQVMVRDSETTVIGGIYVRRGSSNSAAVPGLSRIPVLGHLFKNHRETETRQELLIFITPRILNKKPVIQNI